MAKEVKVTKVLFLIYFVVLTWIILFKMQFSIEVLLRERSVNFIPYGGSVIINGKISYNEIIYNVIAFIPCGIYISMLEPHLPFLFKVLPICLLSLVYEGIQFIAAIGSTDITDLINNTLGGIIGITIFLLFSRILREKTVKILNWTAGISTVLAFGFITILIVSNI